MATCSKWVYYPNPAPSWATARAVQLLQLGHAQGLGPSAAGTVAAKETGQDGRLVQYTYAWHPPDPENETPGGHLGVEVKYCADSTPAPGPSPTPAPTPQLWAIEGVDVSDAQGMGIDWGQVAASGRAFAFIKATEGLPGHFSSPQKSFAGNWSRSAQAKLVRGAYHYFRPSMDAVAQAKHFAQTVKLGPNDLGPALDCEHSDNVESPALYDPSTYGPAVLRYLTTVAQLTGKRPIVYASRDTWPELVAPAQHAAITAIADLWMAAWTSSTPEPGTPPPGTTGAWPAPLFWQYSDHGSVPGIPTAVDLNRFAGSLADLTRIAGQAPSAPGGGAARSPFRSPARAARARDSK